jgi:ADP-heptose:LPS heptosyltransferase
MGDVAMTVPLIRAFLTQNPNIKVTMVSRPFFKPMFAEFSNVSFLEFDEHNRHEGVLGVFKLFFDIKKQNIDAFIDLHNVLRTQIVQKLFSLLGKKTVVINKGRKGKKALTRFENKIFAPQTSMFERHKTVFEQLGFKIHIVNPRFPEKAILEPTTLKLIGPTEAFKLIGIAPFAQHQSKVYPIEMMQKVVAELAINTNFKILLFGGGNIETVTLNSFSVKKPNVINVAGKLTFENELKLISNLDLMLSMDSANAHLAAMYGINTLTLWGSTHPYAGFAPFNQPIDNCLTSDRNQYPKIPTSVYGNKIVAGYEDAMKTITVDRVVSAVQSNIKHENI